MAAQMDMKPEMSVCVGGSFNLLPARIVRWEVADRNDVSSYFSGKGPADDAHMVVRIVVPFEENDRGMDLGDVEVGLVPAGFDPAVLAVVEEVTDMDEDVIWLDALVDSADEGSVMLLDGLERTMRPVDDAGGLGALEVQVTCEECFHRGTLFFSGTIITK